MSHGSPEQQINGRGGDSSREGVHFLFGAESNAKAAGVKMSTEAGMLLGAGTMDKTKMPAAKEGMGAMLADPAELPGVGDGKKGVFSTAAAVAGATAEDKAYDPSKRLNSSPADLTVSEQSKNIAADNIVRAASGDQPVAQRQQTAEADVGEKKKTM
jgi:hypothetical protein